MANPQQQQQFQTQNREAAAAAVGTEATAGVAFVASQLALALSPILAYVALKSYLPKLGVKGPKAEEALKLALEQAERFPQLPMIGLGPAQKAMLETNAYRRAAYVIAAIKRITASLSDAASTGESQAEALAAARQRETRYFNQHVQADAQRVLAGSKIDALASSHGELLGWYAKNDSRTTQECRDADGKNFYADTPPDIGYPGVVHLHCRCEPGKPHRNAAVLASDRTRVVAATNRQRRTVRKAIPSRAIVQLRQRRRAIELAATPDHEHIPGTAYHFKHGWQPVAGSQSRFATRKNDKRKSGGQTKSNFTDPRTGESMSKSAIGDTYEEIFRMRGADILAKKYPGPYLPVAHAETGSGRSSRTTPLDFRINHTFGGELKTLSAKSDNQKTAIKKDEVARKYGALIPDKLQPLLVVQVVDQETNTVKVFGYPQFASKQVRAMEQLGSYTYSNDDFAAAQRALGYAA